MGRRVKTPSLDPIEAREAVARHFNSLMNGVNMVEFRAQLHEEDMVKLIVGFAQDPELTPAFRRDCALDVIKLARGAIKIWAHDGKTIDPNAKGSTGHTIGEEIQAARLTADLHSELDDLVRRNVDPDTWPERVKKVAGDMLTYYSEPDKA